MESITRKSCVFKGKVQGVGFRPTIYNIAKKLGLSGMVLNAPDGVVVEVEGNASQVDKFLAQINAKQPPNSRILRVESVQLPAIGYMSFRILPSAQSGKKTVHIPPDIGTCKECEKELFNPKDRRFGYPFINCTVCGPRFSIIRDVPYDRARTSMNSFHMCSLCEYEYSDPGNRRFHAEPNACEDCGPHIFLLDQNGRRIETLDPILKAVQLIKEGKILAVKGMSGYHLFCDASNPAAIKELRKRKQSPDRPFAVMSYSLKEIKTFAKVGNKEAELLQSPARPVVILKKRKGMLLPEEIASRNGNIGVVMPSAPVHYLIVKDNFLALVMLSANSTGEPIIKDDDKAVALLKGMADYFLVYDRKIINRTDDSIVRTIKNKVIKIRRSKGYVPDPIKISSETMPEILATGAQHNNVFGVSRGKSVILSQYIGDLSIQDTQNFFRKAVSRMESLLRVRPVAVAYDMDPGHYCARYAKALHGISHFPIQHHHAHIASVIAEHSIGSDVIGVAFDGQAYGTDGTVWGGEIFVGKPGRFDRKGHLKPVLMPDGPSAVKEPYKMAFSFLYDAFGEEAFKLKIDFIKKHKDKVRQIRKALRSADAPLTSSAGRLFDAVSSLLGIRDEISYEGQAASELETIAAGKGYKSYNFEISQNNVLDPAVMIREIVEDIKAGVPAENISYKFHNTLGKAIARVCKSISKETKIKKVCLSGGVFQNMLLLEAAIRELKKVRLEVYINEKVPTNNGGIALGQIRIAKELMGPVV